MVEWINLEMMMILGISSTIQLLKYLIWCPLCQHMYPTHFPLPRKKQIQTILCGYGLDIPGEQQLNSLRHAASSIKVVS